MESLGTDPKNLNDIIENWLTVPDFAERLGTVPKSVRSALHDQRIVGAQLGPDKILHIPADFLIGAHLSNPADVRHDLNTGKLVILPSLQGTIILLADMGLGTEEILHWLFTPEAMIGARPIDALREGNRSIVRRTAAALL